MQVMAPISEQGGHVEPGTAEAAAGSLLHSMELPTALLYAAISCPLQAGAAAGDGPNKQAWRS